MTMIEQSVNLRIWNELFDQLDEYLHREYHCSTSVRCGNLLMGQVKYPLEFRLQNMLNDPVVRQLRDDYQTRR